MLGRIVQMNKYGQLSVQNDSQSQSLRFLCFKDTSNSSHRHTICFLKTIQILTFIAQAPVTYFRTLWTQAL